MLLVAVLVLAVPGSARAECTQEAQELRTHLTRESRNARLWNTSWAIGFGAAAVAQVGLVGAEWNPIGTYDRDFEEQMYVGATKASLGALVRIVMPLRVRVPEPAADPCADVANLRAAVADAGRRERRSVWLTIIGGTLVNLAGSALLWERRNFSTAAQSFATGAVVGPISAWTQPRRSWKLWRARRVEWHAGVGVGSLWVAGTF